MVNIELIEELRAKHGYSQRKMAEFLGYESHTAYQRKVAGTRAFLIEDIIKLCKLYQLEPNDLLIIEG